MYAPSKDQEDSQVLAMVRMTDLTRLVSLSAIPSLVLKQINLSFKMTPRPYYVKNDIRYHFLKFDQLYQS